MLERKVQTSVMSDEDLTRAVQQELRGNVLRNSRWIGQWKIISDVCMTFSKLSFAGAIVVNALTTQKHDDNGLTLASTCISAAGLSLIAISQFASAQSSKCAHKVHNWARSSGVPIAETVIDLSHTPDKTPPGGPRPVVP